MRFDKYVLARMREWNPKLNWLDREAIISAWHKSVNFDLWWSGKITAHAAAMRKQGFSEMLGKDRNTYEWKRIK